MQIKRADGDLQQQIAPRGTDLLCYGTGQAVCKFRSGLGSAGIDTIVIAARSCNAMLDDPMGLLSLAHCCEHARWTGGEGRSRAFSG
jgi:hypothetical protein